jgi:hypothetical protein
MTFIHPEGLIIHRNVHCCDTSIRTIGRNNRALTGLLLYRKCKKGKVTTGLKLIEHRTMKTYGEWRYSSTVLNLGIRWKWLCLCRSNRGKQPPLLGGLRSGCYEEEKFLLLPGIEARLLERPAGSLIVIRTDLSWLTFPLQNTK